MEQDEDKQIKMLMEGRKLTYSEYAIFVLFAMMYLHEPLYKLVLPYAEEEHPTPLVWVERIKLWDDPEEYGEYTYPAYNLPDAAGIAEKFFTYRPDWERRSVFAPYDLYPKIHGFLVKYKQNALFALTVLTELVWEYWHMIKIDRALPERSKARDWTLFALPERPRGQYGRQTAVASKDELKVIHATLRGMPDKIHKAHLPDTERQLIIAECDRLLSGHPVKTVIDELARFCVLLARPENHILHQGTQWTFKEYPTRTHSQMTDEMVHELTNLPQFTAYAKILHEEDGARSVKVYKTKTVPMEDIKSENPQSFIEALGCTQLEEFYRPREAVEKEIEEKAGSWGRGEPPPSGGGGRGSPPPSSVTTRK